MSIILEIITCIAWYTAITLLVAWALVSAIIIFGRGRRTTPLLERIVCALILPLALIGAWIEAKYDSIIDFWKVYIEGQETDV